MNLRSRNGRVVTVGARMVRPLVKALAASGLDPEEILARHNLSRDLVHHEDSRAPLPDPARVWEDLERETGDPLVGLHAGQRVPAGAFGLLESLAFACPTLGSAIRMLCRFAPLLQDGIRIESERSGDRATLRIGYAPGIDARMPRHSVEFALAALVTWTRRVVGDVQYDEVHFQHARPEGAEEIEAFFSCPVAFGSFQNALVFHRAYLDLEMTGADAGLMRSLLGYARELLARTVRRDAELEPRIRRVYTEAVAAGEISIQRTARQLGMSRRTLQRRLKRAGTSHKQLVDEARRELAESYLRAPDATIEDVALRLGFSEPSAFTRAFRRWTGMAPVKYRTAHAASD